jgi:hypothetical protein
MAIGNTQRAERKAYQKFAGINPVPDLCHLLCAICNLSSVSCPQLFIRDHPDHADGGAAIIGCAGIADGDDFLYFIFLDKLVDHAIKLLKFFLSLKDF